MAAVGEMIGAGWPLGLALVAAIAGERLGSARRRAALNRGLHELRRPLQVLALAPAAPHAGALDLALAAVDGLDREINGAIAPAAWRPVDCRALAVQAIERWRPVAAREGRTLDLAWAAGRTRVIADPTAIAQALDNLIANALEHGGTRIRVEARRARASLRIVIADSGSPGAATGVPPGADPRRGHGLAIVSRAAADHGGRFVLGRSARGTAAALELPLA